MMHGETEPVRPTKVCMGHLGLSIPPIDEPLGDLEHALIEQAQRLPEAYAAGGVERILSLKDRIWFKVKTSRWRGAATRLSGSGHNTEGLQVALAPWWLGAGGLRRDGDPADFYAALAATTERDGSSDRWLPSSWDWKRLMLEEAYAWEVAIRRIVRHLIARSLRDGYPYQAEFENYRVTALARVKDGETYLSIGSTYIANPKVFAVIINAVPGVPGDSWLPETDAVAGLTTGPGEIVWSTILPPAVAAALLDGTTDA